MKWFLLPGMVPFSLPVGRSRSGGGGGPPFSTFYPFFNQKEKEKFWLSAPLLPPALPMYYTLSPIKLKTLREIKRNADDCLPGRRKEKPMLVRVHRRVCVERGAAKWAEKKRIKRSKCKRRKKEELLAHGRGGGSPTSK